ncbi:MAG: translation initiation factor IF-5A [archaeon]
MGFKLINAHECKEGTFIMVDGAPCVVRNIDISKTGKHGASKCRMEAVGIVDDKKRMIVKPGDDRLDVPMVEKKRGQILTLTENSANIMDIESYETMDVIISGEIKENAKEGAQVEYWDIEGTKIIKRVLG